MTKIVAHYWRNHGEYWQSCDSVKYAAEFLEEGEEEGWLSAVGVEVDGKRIPPEEIRRIVSEDGTK